MTTIVEKMQVFNTVSFDVYPSAILGTSYKNVQVVSICTAADTTGYIDPAATHANVYTTLPPGTPDDFTAYRYYKLKLPNGTITAVGEPWIRAETVEVVTSQTLTIVIPNVKTGDAEKWRLIALANNATDFTITVK